MKREEGHAPPHPAWTIAATMLASSLAFLDGSVTNVALAGIGKDLGGQPADLPWLINAYLLPLSALLLLGGAAGDHYGRRRMLVIGIAIFTLASVGCALAPGFPALLSARVLQGVGSAILMPNSLGILGASFRGEARGRAVGTWAAAGAVASAVGPPLGGWLIDTIGWRSIFYLNLPIAAAAMAAAWLYVEESPREDRPLDWGGGLLVTAALGVLTWSLTAWSGRHEANPQIWAGIAGGLVLVFAFVLHERRSGEDAMMPLALFASRPFIGLTILTLLLYGALGGLLVLLPYLLIVGGGYTPTQAGLALLPFSVVIGTVSRLASRVSERSGPRLPLTVGPLVTAVGFGMMIGVDPDADYWTGVMPAMVVVALGMAGAVAPLTSAVLSAVDGRHTGTASGFNSAIARIGGLIATALVGAVLNSTGPALVMNFRVAAAVGACAAFAAACAAYALLSNGIETKGEAVAPVGQQAE